MPVTRGSKGITAPRVPFVPSAGPQARQTTTRTPATKKKSTASAAAKKVKTAAAKATAGTKANTSKPRVRKTAAAGDKTATGRVTKAKAAPKSKKTATTATKKAAKTVNKREPTLLDQVIGVKDKIVGALEGKPGKKAAGTKKMRGTDGKGATRAKKE
ncbi:MAG: hypothetical protein L6R40_001505 [Gallowayella cf. fulva]|nr:MAG: hypothetical protein L6R40_001505 [Xanthomendoza cf. fulva]